MLYRREIDGLRAVAVLPVILFHSGWQAFGGGFVGVDVFFVISGYLITSIILADLEAGGFSLSAFYERRARRLLPALYTVMLACLPFAWLLLHPAHLAAFCRSLIAVPLFASNFLFWQEGGYFDAKTETKPLQHTWSLAVEEQYYVVFPLLLLVAWKHAGRHRTAALIAVLAAASLGLAHWTAGDERFGAYYLLPTRAWELAIGAIIALCRLDRSPGAGGRSGTGEVFGLVGAGMIAYAVFGFSSSTPFPGLHALVPTLGAALLIVYARPHTFMGRFLGSRVLVGTGLVSYSAYLWHQPVFAFARHHNGAPPGAVATAILVCSSLLLAWLTWEHVEKPFRDARRISTRKLVALAVAASLLFVVLGTLGTLAKGFEDQFLRNRLNHEERATYAMIRKYTGSDIVREMGDDGACNFWSTRADAAFAERFRRCSARHGRALIVLGDSHAMNIYNAMHRAGFGAFVVGVSQGNCRPYEYIRACHYREFDAFLAAHRDAVSTVVFHQAGSYLWRRDGVQTGQVRNVLDGHRYEFDAERSRRIADYLNGLSALARVVWLGPYVEPQIDVSDIRALRRANFRIDERVIAAFEGLDAQIERSVDLRSDRFRYVSLSRLLRIEPDTLLTGDCLAYRDPDHFSTCGELLMGRRMKRGLGHDPWFAG